MATKVVHCKKDKYDVYIGRGSKWGNPFTHKPSIYSDVIMVSSREEAISKYKEWIQTRPDLLAALPEIKDKVLGCWCKPCDCHGDILVELVDKENK